MTASWTVSTSGVEIAAHELGGDGPPLLVAHATGFCGPMYGPMAAHLADRWRVVALDIRGHGDSARPTDGDFHWLGLAADVAAVAEALGEGPIDAMGHSMGGASLLRAESLRPGTFRHVVAFEPIVFPDGFPMREGPSPMVTAAQQRRAEFPDRTSVMWRYASRPPLDALRADVLRSYVTHGFEVSDDDTVRLRCDPADEAAVFGAEGKPAVSDLGGVQADVTLVVGNGVGDQIPAALTRASHNQWPAARLVEVDHVGHFGPFEDPGGLAAVVRQALTASD